jgi:hypothetical protein
MTSQLDPRFSNSIGVIHRKKNLDEPLEQEIQAFIAQYRNARRALWAEDDDDFVTQFDQLNRLIRDIFMDRPRRREMFDTAALMAISLYQAGTDQELRTGEIEFGLLRELVDEELRARIDKARTEARREKLTRLELVGRIEFEGLVERLVSTEKRVPGEKLLIESQRDTGEDADYGIRGTAVYYEDAKVVRLTANQTSGGAYDALKDYVERLIQTVRRRRRPTTDFSRSLSWKDEYAELQGNRLYFGESWDEYPYPHPAGDLPGITTWVSGYGRAEIIIREHSKRQNPKTRSEVGRLVNRLVPAKSTNQPDRVLVLGRVR